MGEFIQYSEEWKAEIKKLPKNTIIEIASQMGKEKQNEINILKEQHSKMLKALNRINEIIYANVVSAGSEEYFEIRGLCCDLTKEATE